MIGDIDTVRLNFDADDYSLMKGSSCNACHGKKRVLYGCCGSLLTGQFSYRAAMGRGVYASFGEGLMADLDLPEIGETCSLRMFGRYLRGSQVKIT